MHNYIYRVAESDTYFWSVANLRWEVGTQPAGGSSDATAANQALEIAALGATTDAAAAGNGSIIGVLKQLRLLLSGGLPGALAAGGGLKVEGVAGGVAQPISAASLPLPTGASTLAEQQTQTTAMQLIDDVVHASDAALGKVAAIGAQFDDTSPGTTTENNVRPVRMSTRRELYVQLRDAAGGERGVNVDANNRISVDIGTLATVAIALGAGTSGTGTLRTTESGCATGTVTSVASTITANTTILAANTARRGAAITNESTQVLTLLVGAGTQSATVYTVKLAGGAYFEVPFGYNGIITGSWVVANGSARVTEYT